MQPQSRAVAMAWAARLAAPRANAALPHRSRVAAITGTASALRVRATGVEKVLGLAFRGGQLYALEMSTTAGSPTPGTGAIVRVNRHGSPETIAGPDFPTGMTVGPDGAFYVSNQGFGFGAGQGQFLRIQP